MHHEPVPGRPASIAFQTVIYENPLEAIHRSLEALDNSAGIGFASSICTGFDVLLGDASPEPTLTPDTLKAWKEEFSHLNLTYVFFDQNTGTSLGHNRIAELSKADFLIVGNPDVVPEPRAIWRMLALLLSDDGVGMVEAKQLPIEHPKDYQIHTGAAAWASGAFFMTPRSLWDQIEGFDATSFFMYCDDVDYSWRVREAGFAVVTQPAAAVFHDKHLTLEGKWIPTETEQRNSPEAALLLAHKWSRDDILEKLIKAYSKSASPHHLDALEMFSLRKSRNELVPQRDPNHEFATFIDFGYEERRFEL